MLVRPQANPVARIKVVGVGGGGGNALNTMVEDKGILDVEFVAVNTDAQALQTSLADVKLRIGENTTRGLGSGGNPTVGRKAAEESIDQIHEKLAGSDMVFITAGMGGGTGTGASPIVGEIAKNLGALTIAVVVKPFVFEGTRRMEAALKGIEELKGNVDTMVVVPNQRLLEIMDPNASFLDALHRSDEVLLQAVKSIANLSTQPGLINVDFADVSSVMRNAGTALMGMGEAIGEKRAQRAAELASESPLLEVKIDNATGVLFHVVGGRDLKLKEVDDAAQVVRELVSPEANFIFGATIDPTFDDAEFIDPQTGEKQKGGKIQVTVIATGFPEQASQAILSSGMGGRSQPQLTETKTAPPEEAPVVRGNIFQPFQQDDGVADEDSFEDVPSFQRKRQDPE